MHWYLDPYYLNKQTFSVICTLPERARERESSSNAKNVHPQQEALIKWGHSKHTNSVWRFSHSGWVEVCECLLQKWKTVPANIVSFQMLLVLAIESCLFRQIDTLFHHLSYLPIQAQLLCIHFISSVINKLCIARICRRIMYWLPATCRACWFSALKGVTVMCRLHQCLAYCSKFTHF